MTTLNKTLEKAIQKYSKTNQIELVPLLLDFISKLIVYYYVFIGIILVTVTIVFTINPSKFEKIDASKIKIFSRFATVCLVLATFIELTCLISSLVLLFQYAPES